MPIRKYRSVTDMPGVRPLRPLDPDNLRIACELSELSFALHPWKLEPGVRKLARWRRPTSIAGSGRRNRCAVRFERLCRLFGWHLFSAWAVTQKLRVA
jgi:hypothetical protein